MLKYIHQDSLNSTSVVTASDGTLISSIKYFPLGGQRNSQGNLPAQPFTGQRLDSTGLYYYGSRYYDPNIGRFISPDTVISNPANPQSFNRYSYCLNNPLKYIDPSGHGVQIQGIDVSDMQNWTTDQWMWYMTVVGGMGSEGGEMALASPLKPQCLYFQKTGQFEPITMDRRGLELGIRH